ALAYRGIRMVIAASFSQTYKRNAFNNGLIVFECPDLVDALLVQYAAAIEADRLTIATDAEATVHFDRSVVAWKGATFAFAPLGVVPQRLIIAGGTEAQIKARLAGADS
ncbi:MAG: homoaconitase, partial [Planctomycetes bacterium]|nr:homoaconitase [Planctomycetota bacterium]